MCMVELPPSLAITDTPGVPGAGVRQQLRERFKIEAAVANFGAPPTSAIPIAENARGPKAVGSGISALVWNTSFQSSKRR